MHTISFLFMCYHSNKLQLREIVEEMFVPNMQAIEVEGQVFEPPKPLSWYPDHLGWQVNVPRSLLRKSAEFAKFQKFIVAETEAVSDMSYMWICTRLTR